MMWWKERCQRNEMCRWEQSRGQVGGRYLRWQSAFKGARAADGDGYRWQVAEVVVGRCGGRSSANGMRCQMGGGRYFAGTQVARPGLR